MTRRFVSKPVEQDQDRNNYPEIRALMDHTEVSALRSRMSSSLSVYLGSLMLIMGLFLIQS